MAGRETNPIQQRMELLSERWEIAAAKPGVNIVRIHAADNEKDLVDTFYTYMLGVDTPNRDIPVIFESNCKAQEAYSKSLLDELKSLVHTWNTANKDSISIKTEPILWEPDFNLSKKDNPAYLFTENMNLLASYLKLGEGIFLVAILKASSAKPAYFIPWLEFAAKAGMNEKFKILLHDTASNPIYEKIAAKYPEKITTFYPNLDMDSAMQQLASIGDPNSPAVQYRQAFVKLTQAIEKRNEKEAKRCGDACIDIAIHNLEKDPYWIGQVIAVYAALANDQTGYKNYHKAIDYAGKGVSAAQQSAQLIKDEFIYRKFLAQAIMLRASLLTVVKDWKKAIADFTTAADQYIYTNDTILAMEACRMAGYCNMKYGDHNTACRSLVKAIGISRQIPAHIVKFTTFAGIIEMLIEINNEKYISRAEVEETAKSLYGKEWMKAVMNWKQPVYEQVIDPMKTIVT